MNAQRGRCVDELADAGVDALLYACLVAVMAQGPGEHRRVEAAVAAQLAERGLPAGLVSSAGALVDALAAMPARRVALVMPYVRPLAEQVVGYLEAEGFEVVDWVALEVARQRRGRVHPRGPRPRRGAGLDLSGARRAGDLRPASRCRRCR